MLIIGVFCFLNLLNNPRIPPHPHPPSGTLADLSMSATLVNRDEKEMEGEEIKV